jgi:hypothetical protein
VRFHPDNRLVAVNDADGIAVWDVRMGKVAGRLRKQETMPGSEPRYRYGSCLSFAPDGRRLATGHPDSTILIWNMPAPAFKAVPLDAKDLESLWADLAAVDAVKAWRAVWRLRDAPHEALRLLRARLAPCPVVPPAAMRKLVADLDDNSFERRQAAEKRLKELRQDAEPALREALRANPSLEQERRIEAVLAALAEPPPPPSAEELRQLRAVAVLAGMHAPEARRVLEELATGVESARLTRAARMALACMP